MLLNRTKKISQYFLDDDFWMNVRRLFERVRPNKSLDLSIQTSKDVLSSFLIARWNFLESLVVFGGISRF